MKRIVVDSNHPETTGIPAERIKIPVVNLSNYKIN
jgi:hypothetical protein